MLSTCTHSKAAFFNQLPGGERSIFKAIEDNYNFERLQSKLAQNSNNINAMEGDLNSVLHILCGADGSNGISLPLRHEPPHKFTQLLIANWKENIDIRNYYGHTPLRLAATVHYSDAVQQLLNNGANPQKALLPYLESTVAFDKDFKIGELLLRYGAKIDNSLLFNLVWSVSNMLKRAEKSGNKLYNDLDRIRHYHFNHLYEKVEWIFKHGAKEKGGVQLVLLDCFRSFLCGYENRYNICDAAIRPLILFLIENCDDISYKDQNGWSLLHWAIYRQCDEKVIMRLKEKGLQSDVKDLNGITPYDLALLNMNRKLIMCMRPEVNVGEVFDQLQPDFFGALIKKLPVHLREFNGLPALLRANNLCAAERRLLAIYEPILLEAGKDGTDRMITPIAAALLQNDFLKIHYFIENGWNISIENVFLKDFLATQGKVPKGFRDVFDEKFGNSTYSIFPADSTIISVLKALNSSPVSGITLSSEFDYALIHLGEKITEKDVFALFNAGLNGDVYYQQTGSNLQKKINQHYSLSYSDDRGFHEYSSHKAMLKINAYVDEFNICKTTVHNTKE